MLCHNVNLQGRIYWLPSATRLIQIYFQVSLSSLWACWWTLNDLKVMTVSRQKTMWLPCFPACLFLPCQAMRYQPEAWQTKALQGGGGGQDGLKDGCPIHQGCSCWWAKELTCSGEGKVASKESALFDNTRFIIQTRAVSNLSVWWQQAEWLLPLWAKRNVLTDRKRL